MHAEKSASQCGAAPALCGGCNSEQQGPDRLKSSTSNCYRQIFVLEMDNVHSQEWIRNDTSGLSKQLQLSSKAQGLNTADYKHDSNTRKKRAGRNWSPEQISATREITALNYAPCLWLTDLQSSEWSVLAGEKVPKHYFSSAFRTFGFPFLFLSPAS